MNKDELLDRLNKVEGQISQTLASLNMLMGGKNELLYWLQLAEKAAEVVTEAVEHVNKPDSV